MSLPVDPAVLFLTAVAAVAAIIYGYYFSPQANQPDIHPLQLAEQSSVSKVRESTRESAIYRSKRTPEGTDLLSSPSSEFQNLRDAIRAARPSANPDAVVFLETETKITKVAAGEVANHVSAFAGGLQRLVKTDGSKAAAVIALKGSTEFLVAYQACLEAGVVAVPVYVDETPENTAAIVAHSKAQVLITSTEIALKLGGLLTSSSLTHAVVLGELDGSDEAEAVRSAVAVVSFEELQQGEGVDKDVKIAPTDPAYVLYETDESAKLRGVVVSHANALGAVSGILANLPADKGLTSKDSFMSAMPMAEPTNLSFVNTALLSGCSICVCETTDAELFATQAYPFAPTFTYMNTTITSDLFQLFFSHIEKYPNFEATLFKRGYKSVVDTLMRGMRPKRNFTDFAYLRHYRNVIGGKLRLLYLSADVPSKHVEWFRVLHGAHVIPVFGTAQTAGVATAGHFYDYASAIENHNVGAPLACNEIKLIDATPFSVEDSPNPRGAIVVRGSNVSASLWNEDSVALNDGWLTLPIIGEVLPNGTFEIIGPLSTVAKSDAVSGPVMAQPLERTLLSTDAITDVCVFADSKSRKVTAVAHPRPMALYRVAHMKKKTYKIKQIQDYPWCADYVRDELLKVAASKGLAWVAELGDNFVVKLVPEPFSLKNKLAFANGSINRAAVKKLLDA